MPRKYGCLPDAPDARDFVASVRPGRAARPRPAKIDLEPKFPPVYDQGDANSCVGNAVAAAFEYDNLRQPEVVDFSPSRLFIYYNARAAVHDTAADDGAQIRDGIKGIAKYGACPEPEWPYDVAQVTRRPEARCYTDARKHKAVLYQRVPQTLDAIQTFLATEIPVVFGMAVFESFESTAVERSGVVNMPERGEKQVGAHAVVLAGYDAGAKRFKVRNSWGKAWGQRGYFTLPFAYVVRGALASDFWVARSIT